MRIVYKRVRRLIKKSTPPSTTAVVQEDKTEVKVEDQNTPNEQ
jgi:hypothetical protein